MLHEFDVLILMAFLLQQVLSNVSRHVLVRSSCRFIDDIAPPFQQSLHASADDFRLCCNLQVLLV